MTKLLSLINSFIQLPFQNDCKQAAAKKRRQSTRLENLGISEEELLRQQQELFAKARQQMNEEFQMQQIGLQTLEAKNGEEDSEEDY